jgi:hypothetical protein
LFRPPGAGWVLIPLTILSQGFGVESLAPKFLGVIEEAVVRDRWTLQIGLPEEAAKVGQFINSGQSLRTRVLQLNELRLILWTSIRPSIGTRNLIPEEVNYTKIAIRVPVMNKVQFLLASEPRKPLKPRSLYVIFLVKKDMGVKRRRTCDYHHHKKL